MHKAVNRRAAGAFPSLQTRRPSDICLEGFAMKRPTSAPLPSAIPDARAATIDSRPDRRGARSDCRRTRRR